MKRIKMFNTNVKVEKSICVYLIKNCCNTKKKFVTLRLASFHRTYNKNRSNPISIYYDFILRTSLLDVLL